MQFFQPKHYNNILRSWDDGIFISFDNRITMTNKLKNKLMKFDKYQILYEDSILTYDELKLIDTVISVCCVFDGYLLLLTTGKLIYIVSHVKKSKILSIKKVFDCLNVDYISNNKYYSIVYSMNNLYLVNRDFYIKIYSNVIGYLCYHNIVLILLSDNRINLISHFELYKIDEKGKNKVNCDDMLNGINYADINDIYIHHSEIYIIVSGKIMYWSSGVTNYFYEDIKDMNNIKQITKYKSGYFCMLTNGRLFFKNIEGKYCMDMDICCDVIKYLVINEYLVCFHSNFTCSVIDYTKLTPYKQSEYSYIPRNTILYSFLKNPTNINTINCIEVYILNDSNNLIYLNNNTVNILDIKSVETIKPNKFFDCDDSLISIQLYDNSQVSYI